MLSEFKLKNHDFDMRCVMPSLVDFAVTDRQRQAVEAYERLKSYKKAAQELKINDSTLVVHINKVKRRAVLQGWSPDHGMVHTVPEPHIVKGLSTLYDSASGEPIIQWVKTSVEHEKLIAMMREVVDELKQDVTPIQPIKLLYKDHQADLLNLYTLSDAHIGMLAWNEDGGADWDLKIAEKTIMDAFGHLIACSPNAKHAFFAQLGDGLHSDGMKALTPGHGHILDQDGRYPKVVRTAIRIFRNVVAMLLQKHKEVTVLMAQGNHDEASSVWLQEMFSVVFEKNKRVNVIVSPKPYYAFEHGDVMLGFHHGHKKNPAELSDVFTAEFRPMYGRTKRTYIHSGHFHSAKVIETRSAHIQQHGTLAARDAHASHNAYKSERSIASTTYHKTRFRYAENYFNV